MGMTDIVTHCFDPARPNFDHMHIRYVTLGNAHMPLCKSMPGTCMWQSVWTVHGDLDNWGQAYAVPLSDGCVCVLACLNLAVHPHV